MLQSFDFSSVRSIYLDEESLKDFVYFGPLLDNLISLDLRGISEKSAMSEALCFLPEKKKLETLSISTTFLKQVPSIIELLLI